MGDLRRLSVLMATVFVDMIGFFIVLPLLPFYAERLGADASAVGALVSAFAAAQLAMAPLWGRLSDRYGRRPILLAGLGVSTAAYLIFGLASAVWLLFLSRLVQGAAAGTVGVVQAYVSDAVAPSERAKALGWLTAATSAGVTVGPAIGSLAAGLGPTGPGFVAAGLCFLNLLSAWRWLPEPEQSSRDRAAGIERAPGRAREALFLVFSRPRSATSALIWIYAAAMMAFMAMNGVIALYLGRRFGIDEQTIGYLYVFIGLVSVVMRLAILGPLVRRLGEVRVMRIGAISLAVGLLTIPLPGSLAGLALAVMCVPIGTALLFPTTTSLVSRRAPRGETGLLMGTQQSVGGVARMIGPLWSGPLFEHVGIAVPFWLAGAVMLATLGFAVTTIPVQRNGVRNVLGPPPLDAEVP